MTITPTQLLEADQKRIEDRWKAGESAADLDREFDLRDGAVRDWAYRKGWTKENDTWEYDVKIEQLQGRVNQLTRQYKKAVKDSAIADRFMEAATNSLSIAEVVEPYTIPIHQSEGTEHRAVALLSDLHVGEVVSAAETNHLSEYNTEIFKERMQLWTEKVVELVGIRRNSLTLPSLNIFLLGDVVSGDIHEELSNTNDGSIIDQVVVATHEIAKSLITLASHFEHIEVSGVAGNHGRLKKVPYFKLKQRMSWDTLIYQMLALVTKNQPNISYHIPASFWTVRDVLGTRFLLLHGDGINSWNGIPWYGLERMFSRFQSLIGKDCSV